MLRVSSTDSLKPGFMLTSLYVHFEGLTTDSYFGKTRPPVGGHIEKKFYYSSDGKTQFLTFPVVLKWSKLGGEKSICSFEGLTTESYFAKTRPPGEDHIEKRFFNTLLMTKHNF